MIDLNEYILKFKETAKQVGEKNNLPAYNLVRNKSLNIKLDYPENVIKESIISLFTTNDKTIKDFKWFPEYDKIVKWFMGNDGKGLALFGTSGSGKSRMLYSVIPILIYKATKEMYLTYPVKSWDVAQNIDKLLNRAIVAIDEVGREPITSLKFSGKVEVFQILLDECESQNKLLLITSNLTAKQYIERYDMPYYNRLLSKCEIVNINQENQR